MRGTKTKNQRSSTVKIYRLLDKMNDLKARMKDHKENLERINHLGQKNPGESVENQRREETK